MLNSGRPFLALTDLNEASSANPVLGVLRSWDLGPVRKKVLEKCGWDPAYAIRVEAEYRKFMSLMLVGMKEALGISRDVDEFWHHHILDTIAYFEFCGAIFGCYIHHRPRHEAGTPVAYRTTLRLLELGYSGRDDVIWPDAAAEPHADCACQSGCDKIDAGPAQVAIAG